MKLLVIDDDVNICELISLYFEKEGFEVKAAHDGADGMIAFRTFDPDIVLLDIMLPGKDGGQVCREIRKISSRPVVMITARGDVFDRVLGLELGADDYITKHRHERSPRPRQGGAEAIPEPPGRGGRDCKIRQSRDQQTGL